MCIFCDGEISTEYYIGLANFESSLLIDPRTVFHTASISKQFTALSICLLIEDGLVDLSNRIGDFIPDLSAGSEITVAQILHHVSGLRDQWGLLDLAGWRHEDIKTDADVLALARRQTKLNFAPGQRFQYINTGYTLLGLALAEVTGQSLADFAKARIFEPLGMVDTLYQTDAGCVVPNRAMAYDRATPDTPWRRNVPAYATCGPTGLLSTVRDFAGWERNFLNPTVCSPETIAAMTRSGKLPDGTRTGYGFGLALGEIDGVATQEHAGGDAAFRSHYLRLPERKWAVAIFCNTSELQPGQIARDMAREVIGAVAPVSGATLAESSRASGVRAPDPDKLTRFCGLYREPGGQDEARLTYRDGVFRLESPDGAEFELAPLDDTGFAFAGLDATCRLELQRDGPVRMLTYFGGTETARLEAVPDLGTPTKLPAIEEYTGTYASVELDLVYRVIARDGAPWLDRGRKGCHLLEPFDWDRFTCKGGLVLAFERDSESNGVIAMTVSTERVWNVRFSRQ